MVYLFENAEGIENALLNCSNDLKKVLTSGFHLLLEHPDFEEGLLVHLHPDHASFQVKRIKDTLNRLLSK